MSMSTRGVRVCGWGTLAGIGLGLFLSAVPVAGQEGDAALYREAYALVLEERWRESMERYADLLDRFPNSEWVDDTQYWLCHIASRQGQDAATAFECFERFVADYRQSPYRDDAQTRLIELGETLARQGNAEYADKVRGLRNGQGEEVALMALRALAELGDAEALEGLLTFYDTDLSEAMRARIVRLLEDFDLPEARTRLIEIARDDPADSVRASAIRSLEDLDWDDEISAFIRETARSDQAVMVRISAVHAIEEQGTEWISFLADLASTADVLPVSFAALGALEDIGGSEAVAALEAIAASSAPAAIRQRALNELGETGGAAAVPQLARVLREDPDSRIRRGAARALGEVGGPEAVEVLRAAALDGSRPDVQRVAIDALGEIGTEDAREALLEVLRRGNR